MTDHSLAFLKTLLATPGPSGDEAAVAHIWRQQAATFADEVTASINGSSIATLNGNGPRIMLAGHIDEIGLMISYIDNDGYLWFDEIGGWDPTVFIGQRVKLLGRNGPVMGVVGRQPVHLMDRGSEGKEVKTKQLWIDIGVASSGEASELVRVGDVGVIDTQVYELPNRRIVSRSLDNRIGAFVVLEALCLLAEDRPIATVSAVATSYEEITAMGARTSAYTIDPLIAIAVDVTFATDHPESSKQEWGDVKLGGGPVLSRGSANHPVIYSMLIATAERENIPYSLQITPRHTGTDADHIQFARGGVATAIVSIPNRYMHSPNEMVQLDDVEQAAKLLAAFVRSVNADTDLVPR